MFPRIEIVKKIEQVKKKLGCNDIIECGCGCGINLILLNRLFDEKKISGFEYFATRYATSLENFEIHNVKPENFFLADCRNIPCADQSFDLLFTCHVLEQLKTDLEQAVSEVLRVAKKGVIFIEPSVYRATFTERLYLRFQQYCENIIDLIRDREDIKVIEHMPRIPRSWHEPSNYLIIQKTNP